MGLIHKHNVCAVNYVMYTPQTHQKLFSQSIFDSSPTKAVVMLTHQHDQSWIPMCPNLEIDFEINPRLFTSSCQEICDTNMLTFVHPKQQLTRQHANLEFVSVNLYNERLFKVFAPILLHTFVMHAPDNSSYNTSNIRVCSPVHVAAVD